MDADGFLRYRFSDVRVCRECVEDPDLQRYIAAADGEPGCSFCGADDAPTCGLLDFVEHVRECIAEEYDLAANWLPWESREGGWQWDPVWSTYDLIVDQLQIGFARAGSDELVGTLADCLGHDDWCERDPYGEDPLETLRLRWRQFCELTKHHTRFFLDRWTQPSSHESLGSRRPPTPAMTLTAIGDRIRRMDLFQTFPAGRAVYRARYIESDKFLRTPEDLGPPPPEYAVVANRMSPPGIVMFYAALDSETALRETATGPGRFAVGEFRVLRPLWLLDLTQLPKVPGFFATIPDSRPWGRQDAQFFRELVQDFTRPIARDDRLHIEYIPTQVVTEYCRLAFHHEHRTAPLDGIVYPSARNFGSPAVVLFADRAAVVGTTLARPEGDDVPWLKLVGVEHYLATGSFQFSPLGAPFE